MNRMTLLRLALATSVVAGLTAGCSAMYPAPKVDVYRVNLSGSQEVPPANTAGSGQAELRFDSASSTLSWRITYSGLTGPATGAHIHGPAAPGQNAGVVVPFPNPAVQPIQGQVVISAQQASDLAAGRWYVNIHSARFPGGEIRGQIVR